jgi:hypothetical protein
MRPARIINGDGYSIPLDPFPQILAPCRYLGTNETEQKTMGHRRMNSKDCERASVTRSLGGIGVEGIAG